MAPILTSFDARGWRKLPRHESRAHETSDRMRDRHPPDPERYRRAARRAGRNRSEGAGALPPLLGRIRFGRRHGMSRLLRGPVARAGRRAHLAPAGGGALRAGRAEVRPERYPHPGAELRSSCLIAAATGCRRARRRPKGRRRLAHGRIVEFAYSEMGNTAPSRRNSGIRSSGAGTSWHWPAARACPVQAQRQSAP